MKIKNFHFRVHHLLCEDKTPFLHTHPFYYISIVISGGYTETVESKEVLKTKMRNKFSVAIRRPDVFHRIDAVLPNTKTIFLTVIVPGGWRLKRHPCVTLPSEYWDAPDGVYVCKINQIYRLRKNGIWCTQAESPEDALQANNPSIHQDLRPGDWRLVSN